VPDVPTHAGRVNAQKHIVVSDLGLVYVPELQNIG
jgi:hypothetical protein